MSRSKHERTSEPVPGSGWRLLGYLSPYWLPLLTGALLTLMTVGFQLAIPLAFGRVFLDELLVGGADPAMLNGFALGALGLFAVKGLVTYGRISVLAVAGQRMVHDLRAAVFAHLQKLSLRFFQQSRTGETIARLTNDITLIQHSFTTGLYDFMHDSLISVGIVGCMFFLHWRLSLISLVVFPLVGWAISTYGRRVRRFTAQVQQSVADISTQLQETLTGIRVVKAFTMEEEEKRRFKAHNRQAFEASMRSAKSTATAAPLVELMMVLGMVVVFWYGGQEVVAGRLTPGELTAFIAYLGMAVTPIMGVTRTVSQFQQATAAGERVFQILDEEIEVAEAENPICLPIVRGEVRFENVSFAYSGGEEVLRDINLTVKPGEVVALVGPSGAGKSTLVNLLPRFYDPTKGRILLDGHDLRDLRLSELRRHIGLVPQETILFGVSVAANIRFGRPEADDAAVEEAARLANAHDFIVRLPQGYDTLVGERGTTLSGGQQQRVAIARAILRDPRLLILDEATSNLDTESEGLVQAALERLMEGRTTFVIAHRLSTVMNAHRILVLQEGRIVEEGRHEQLLERDGVYRRLYEAQFRHA